MSRSPYAIRKGFEYQDLFCCCELLTQLETESLDQEFEIESDEAEHVDDLVIYGDADSVVGNQVKFHVDQDYAESFDTLTKKRTPRSRSLLEKLYQGWVSLKSSGRTNVRVVFVSSNPAERGRYKLGPVIDTATGRFRDKFFQHRDYQRPLEDFCAQLDVEKDELRAFLADLKWRLSYESIDGLRRLAARSLKRLHLPSDEDAIPRLMEIVGSLANSNTGKSTLRSFVQTLWGTSRFRDACEQQFHFVDFGTSQQRRANTIRIATVALETLPAMHGSRYACTEEPFPFSDYRFGVTATDQEGLLDHNRASWKHEYVDWLSQRVLSVLSAIEAEELDVIVFPRFSLPIQVAAHVAEWGRNHRVHCVVGGHSLPDSEKERTTYETGLNLTIPYSGSETNSQSDLVLDSVVRFDRAGRVSISQLDSPFSKAELVVSSADSVALEANDGWINAVLIPSRDIAREYLGRTPARPELAIISAGIHAADALDELAHNGMFTGLPVVVCSSHLNTSSSVVVIDPQAPTLTYSDAWEGVRVFSVSYERSHRGWEARVRRESALPFVYSQDDAEIDASAFESLRGSPASRNDAIERIQHGEPLPAILCHTESNAEFFFRRAKEADTAIREQLSKASPTQIAAFTKTLEAIGGALEGLRKEAFLPPQFAPPPQTLLPMRSSQFFNRAKEKANIGRFLSTNSNKAVLLLHGPPGIGKRELLTDVQRIQADRNAWVRFRCTPDSRLVETLAQLLARLGVTGEVPQQADGTLFRRISQAVQQCGAAILVLEEAHCLPISSEHHDHPAFLEMMAFFCADAQLQARIILISDWRGHLQFSGSHRMEQLRIHELEDEYVVELLQEHLAETPSRYAQPTVDELWTLASKLHGHPFMARLASVVLEDNTVSEVAEKLYSRVETRNFVLGRLLGGITLSEKEQQFLEFASILRLPVSSEAFIKFGGPSSHSLLDELLNRFLMASEDGRYRMHPVLVEFYSAGIQNADTSRRLHSIAFEYYSGLSNRRSLSVAERREYIYHGVSSGASLDLADMQMFAGSVRSALDAAVRNRDWAGVESAAQQLLSVWPYDVSGHIAMALALDASGREHEADNYAGSLEQVTSETLWIAVEFVKNLIRRRDFDAAERNLAVVQQRFANHPRVVLAETQLHERKGQTDEAVECCERVISSPTVREADAFLAALSLRDANRSDLVVKHLSSVYEERGFRNDGLLRLYSLASVLTNYDPDEGLQVLSDLWDASHKDGYAVADYAAALVELGRTADAKAVLERGRDEVPRRSRGYRSVLEAYASLFESQEQYTDAFQMYRDAIRIAPNHLHIYRRFAACLLSAAASFRLNRMSAQEDSALAEAKQVLAKLLQMAPLDSWAVDAMHRAEHRTY